MIPKQSCLSSGIKTATDAAIPISTVAGKLVGVSLIVGTTSDPIVVVYDNASARTGTVLYKRKIDSSLEGFGGLETLPTPVVFQSGCVLSVTGTDGADAAIVYFAPIS